MLCIVTIFSFLFSMSFLAKKLKTCKIKLLFFSLTAFKVKVDKNKPHLEHDIEKNYSSSTLNTFI